MGVTGAPNAGDWPDGIPEADPHHGELSPGSRPVVGRPVTESCLQYEEERHEKSKTKNDVSPKISGPSTVSHQEGYPNLGNSCYMNAVMQALLHLRMFVLDLGGFYQQNKQHFSTNSVTVSLQRLADREVRGRSGSIKDDLMSVLTSASSPDTVFTQCEQQDAHEFLNQVLDFLKEEDPSKPKQKKVQLGQQGSDHTPLDLRTVDEEKEAFFSMLNLRKKRERSTDEPPEGTFSPRKRHETSEWKDRAHVPSESSHADSGRTSTDNKEFTEKNTVLPESEATSPEIIHLISHEEEDTPVQICLEDYGALENTVNAEEERCTSEESRSERRDTSSESAFFDEGISEHAERAETNPTFTNFELEVLRTRECVSCHKTEQEIEKCTSLMMTIPEELTSPSIQNAVDAYFQREEIDYKCDNCGPTTAIINRKCKRLPRVLILYLKRYDGSNRKLDQNLQIEKVVRLQQHCNQETDPPMVFPHTLASSENPTLSGIGSELPSQSSLEPCKGELAVITEDVGPNNSRKDDASYTDNNNNKSNNNANQLEGSPIVLQPSPPFTKIEPSSSSIGQTISFGETEDPENDWTLLKSLYDNYKDGKIIVPCLSEEQQMVLAMELSLNDSRGIPAGTDEQSAERPCAVEYGSHITGSPTKEPCSSVAAELEVSRQEREGGVGCDSPGEPVSLSDSVVDQRLNGHEVRTRGRYITKRVEFALSDKEDILENVEERMKENNKTMEKKESGINGFGDTETRLQNDVDDGDAPENKGESVKEDMSALDKKVQQSTLKVTLETERGETERGDPGASESNIKQPRCQDALGCSESAVDENEATERVGDQQTGAVASTRSCHDRQTTTEPTSGSVVDGNSDETAHYRTSLDASKNEGPGTLGRRKGSPADCPKESSAPGQLSQGRSSEADQPSHPQIADMTVQSPGSASPQPTYPFPAKDTVTQIPTAPACRPDIADQTHLQKSDSADLPHSENASTDDQHLPLCQTPPAALSPTATPEQSPGAVPVWVLKSHEEDTNELPASSKAAEANPHWEQDEGDWSQMYRLVSIVNHMGPSCNSGHYTADVMEVESGRWFNCNDEVVVQSSEDQVLSICTQTGYIFFYMNWDIFQTIQQEAQYFQLVQVDEKQQLKMPARPQQLPATFQLMEIPDICQYGETDETNLAAVEEFPRLVRML